MNRKKQLLFTGIIITLMLLLMGGCGSPSTLEEYVNSNSDVQQAIESMEKTIGDNGSVTVKDNNLCVTYVMPDSYDDATLSAVKEQMQTYMNSKDSTFQQFEDQLKEESGIDNATVTVIYQDASKKEIFSKEYK